MSDQKDRRDGPGRPSAGGREGESRIHMDRRGFLTLSALGGCAMLTGPGSAQAARGEFGGWPKAYGMLVDLTACVGCRSCERACNETWDMPGDGTSYTDPAVFGQERRPTSQTYTVVNRYIGPEAEGGPVYRKVQCNHCLEPACATACPIHAYTKTPEGAVTYNEELCFGCRYCMIGCPFHMPSYTYERPFDPKIVKCIFCHPRIREGKLPACGAKCPTGALTFGRRTDLIRLGRKRIIENPDKYIDHIYGENEVGGTSWMYLSAVPFDMVGLPTNLPKKPLIELTRNYLSSVPMIFTVWPALFGLVYAAVKHREKYGAEHEHPETKEGRDDG